MNVEIIPAIIEDTWEAVQEKILRLKGKTDWVHIDASDGVFTGHKTWNNPKDLLGIDTDISIEAHLMIARPWEVIDTWLQDSIRRIIIHRETFGNDDQISEIVERVKDTGRQTVFAVNPETPWQEIEPYLESIDGVLVMGVEPGWSGSGFHPEVVEKIKTLRARWPNGIIGVDGGVNADRAADLVSAGANRLVSSSFVFSFDNPAEGLKNIREAIQKHP